MEYDKEISQFLNNQKALIVEPSNAFYSVIQSCLTSYGMSAENILFAGSYQDATLILKEVRPQILVTEYSLGKFFGLSLVEMHGEYYDSSSRISIMVTKESSDNAVAEAAEEQLDAYIVKPFSISDFKTRLLEVIKRKMYPSDYSHKINVGKEMLKEKKLPEAISLFQEAKELNPKPSLACYYLGECFMYQRKHSLARQEFAEGRSYNPLHYKCLTGEFDCLMAEKNYNEAYKLVGVIRGNFPVTSVRLGKFFIAAVYTESFQDVSSLYELYTNLEYRPSELVNLVSMALITAGRFYLRRGDGPAGLGYFEMASTASGRGIEYLEKIVDELLKVSDFQTAEHFLKYTRSDDMSSPKYHQLNFKISRFVLPLNQTLEFGRKIVIEGNSSPEVTKIIIKLAVENKKITLAESLVIKALEKFPDLRKELYEIIEGETS